MAGGITGLGSNFLSFLSNRGHNSVPNRLIWGGPPIVAPRSTITTGGQVQENFMNSAQSRTHIQEAVATLEANAQNNLFGNETNFQKTTSTVDTNIDTGNSLTDLLYNARNLEIIDLGNENHADVRSAQNVEIAQVGQSEDGAVATNNAYFNEDNTQLSNSDGGVKINETPAPNPNDPHPNYLLSWFGAVQNGSQDPTGGVNQTRRDPVFNFANATSELMVQDREALAGLIRQVGKNVSGQSRQAARAIYSIARIVGSGANSSSLNRNIARLEEALQPLDPNVGFDYNGRDAQAFAGAIQYLIGTLPDFLMEDPELVGEIQYALADIANSLAPGGQLDMVA